MPFNRPAVLGTELDHIRSALASRRHAGDHEYGRRCEKILCEVSGASAAFLTPSGTAALEMAALLLDIGPGDEVVVPSFTFPSTANAFALRGARIVFADVRADTLNIDEERLERLLTARTKVIVAVHYAGVACEMDEITAIASARGIAVVEDNAQGLFGRYRDRPLGSLGALAALSFHETKNVSCGEGGALLVSDPRHIERAEIVREKGTDRSRFFRGQVEKYTWVDLGSSYLLPEIAAAMLFAQLEGRQVIQARRHALWRRYASGLADWAVAHGVQLPAVPAHCAHPSHIFYLLMPSEDARSRLIHRLAEGKILAVFHYLPLHLSVMGQGFGGRPGDCPVTENIAERILRLPLYFDLSDAEQDEVINTIREFAA